MSRYPAPSTQLPDRAPAASGQARRGSRVAAKRLVLASGLALCLLHAAGAPIAAQSGSIELGLSPSFARIDCMGDGSLRLLLEADGAGAESVELSLRYDPRILSVEKIVSPSGRFQMQVETGTHIDMSAYATAEAEGLKQAPGHEVLRLSLEARRPGAPWPSSLVSLRLRGLVAGTSAMSASARFLRADGSVVQSEARAQLEVSCPGMTPVAPENDGDVDAAREPEMRSDDAGVSADVDGLRAGAAEDTADSADKAAPIDAAAEPATGDTEALEPAGDLSPASFPVTGPSRAVLLRESACRHRLAFGESLLAVAARHGVRYSELVRANRLPAPRLARPGQILRIPSCLDAASARPRLP